MATDPFTPAGGVPDPDEDFADPFARAGAASPKSLIEEAGSYRRMPDPLNGGRPKRFTRATKFAGTVTDDYVLTEWKLALAVLGVSHNHGLYADAASEPMPNVPIELRPKGWWRPWAELAHEAIDWADGKTGARLGTAVHRWTEQAEYGHIRIKDVPKPWRPHVEALLRLRAQHKLVMLPEYRETMILNRGLHNGVSGKYDSMLLGPDGRLIIDDTKTGKQVPEFGIAEIAVQLAIYAHAEFEWVDGTGPIFGYRKMPENIRQDAATVTWIPIDRPEDAELIPINIDEGWEEAQRIVQHLRYRNKSRRKHDSLTLSVEELFDPEQSNDSASHQILACSSVAELNAVIDYLFALGKYEPRHVLLATGVKHALETRNNDE